jgi:hypothetical protein
MAAVVDCLLHLHGNLIMGPSLAPASVIRKREAEMLGERERDQREGQQAAGGGGRAAGG